MKNMYLLKIRNLSGVAEEVKKSLDGEAFQSFSGFEQIRCGLPTTTINHPKVNIVSHAFYI